MGAIEISTIPITKKYIDLSTSEVYVFRDESIIRPLFQIAINILH